MHPTTTKMTGALAYNARSTRGFVVKA